MVIIIITTFFYLNTDCAYVKFVGQTSMFRPVTVFVISDSEYSKQMFK
jgi:hypothetical protein